jgi:hypothetical protein
VHPIKKLKAAFAAFLQTTADLSSAVEANTAATAALLAAAIRIEKAATETAAATSYLHRAERHRRQQSGQRVEV